MACLRAVQPRATSVAATKTRVPSIVHPLSSSGYLIIIQFILSCVVNVLIFSLAYSFLVLAFPISLLYKIGQKCVVRIRVLSQGGGKADVGNSSEKFWFVSTDETRFPSLFLLLIVKGELGIELVNFLIHNRLSYCKGEVGKTHLSRLARTPRLIFHELMWFETNLDDNPIKEVNPKRIHLFEFKKRKFTIENPTSDVDWQVYHYSNEEGLANNNIIFFGFHHSYADLYTFVYFLSGNFLDKTAFAFRNEVSSTQAFCLSCIALLAGPSIFVKSLLKANNAIFLEPTGKKERAIFFSEPVSRLLVETITTVTGASGRI